MPGIDPPSSPTGDGSDPLKRMRVYHPAETLAADAWGDAEELKQNQVTAEVAGQLYKALGSIAANIAEGYSRSSGRDRARIFEYALGSARESVEWYKLSLPVLGTELVGKRRAVLEEILRMLIAVIPRERNRTIRPRKHLKDPPNRRSS